ncbi:hypothetical protein TM2_14320 [Bacillus altitudinis]|nr:hypothetical protein TM2_14320 [Bacillus altitudinis]
MKFRNHAKKLFLLGSSFFALGLLIETFAICCRRYYLYIQNFYSGGKDRVA